MPVTEDDLRTLLADHAATSPPAAPGLAAAARSRGQRLRRRRQGIGGVAVAAAVLVAGSATVLAPGKQPHRPAPAATAPTSFSPPQYYNGGRLLVATTVHSPQSAQATMSAVPTSQRLTFAFFCQRSWDDAVHVTLGTADFGIGGCSPSGRDSASFDLRPANSPRRAGAEDRVGELISAVITITHALKDDVSSKTPKPLPVAERPSGDLTVAVYERVPVAEYQFPKPPAHLNPLDTPTPDRGYTSMDSRNVGANGHFRLRARAHTGDELRTISVAPGALTFSVMGHVIGTAESWDYTDQTAIIDLDPKILASFGVHVRANQPIDVDVTASRFAHPAWTIETS